MKFDESNGSQVEKLPIDVGDKDPLEAIQDLSIGKISPTEVKESTSSSKWKLLLHDKVNQESTRKHPQVGHTKMKETRKCIKMNVNNLLLHHDKRTPTPTMKKAKFNCI